jgi:hypothetical protein
MYHQCGNRISKVAEAKRETDFSPAPLNSLDKNKTKQKIV